MRIKFVQPNARRLYLSEDGGDWIEVKERLTFGEGQRLQSAAMKLKMSSSDMGSGHRDDNVSIDMSQYKLARMEMYLLDWSARDELDKSIKLTHEALVALDEESATAIDAALDRHIEEMAARAADPTPFIDAVAALPS